MLKRFLPHPLLTLALTIVWVFLLNDFSVGGIVLGFILGVALAAFTSSFWPDRSRVRNFPAILEYVVVVVWDILVANVQVAWIVLTKSNATIRPAFITVPLEIRAPEAITVLAGTITMTPGTVSADLSADGRAILVHCLHTDDPQGVARDIKARYETRLKEIFS